MTTNNMKWFTFSQNNSGGYFHGPRHVVVQAVNAAMANAAAESFAGVYFDGCSWRGLDCQCCGDRWSRTWDGEYEDKPMLYGVDVVPNKNVMLVYFDGRTEGGQSSET